MDCRGLLERISAYLDGDLDATDCAAIEAHCATCAECRDVIGGLRRTVGLCRQAARSPLPDDVRARASQRVRELLARTPPPLRRKA